MKLEGFEVDSVLNDRLLTLQDDAAPIVPSGPRRPRGKNKYYRALADAWEAGQLLPVVYIKQEQGIE